MGFFIFQKYDTDVTFEKVMGQCHLSLTVAANDREVLYRRKTFIFAFRRTEMTLNMQILRISRAHSLEEDFD